jgi:ribosomal subunit interface protein
MSSRIKVTARGIEYTKKLEDTLEKKLLQVDRLLPRGVVNATYEVELGKASKHHKTGKIYRAEVNLSYNDVLHRAVGTEETIENAIDVMKNELKSELRKTRTKSKDIARDGGRELKRRIRST